MSKQSTIRFACFPRTQPPPVFISEVIKVFKSHEGDIATHDNLNSLNSDGVLHQLRSDLVTLGFEVEAGKKRNQKIERPVFFGEDGVAEVRYEVDAYHVKWKCGLEVEAGRGWLGNAFYRDLILASLMVDVDHLIVAVANQYWSKAGGKDFISKDYDYAKKLADTIYSHRRLAFPYGLTVVGY